MKKLMIAALAAVAMVGAAQAASSVEWTFDMSKMGSENPEAIMDGFNATEVGGTSDNPVGAGYAVYYIWGVDNSSQRAAVRNAFISGLRAGKTAEQVISDEKMTLFATSQTDKDGYVASVKKDVDTSLYYTSGGSDRLSVLEFVLAKDEDYVFAAWTGSASENAIVENGTVYSIYLRDNTLNGSYISPGWYAIPEPTSGLLLLLGVAGLALKRKRQ